MINKFSEASEIKGCFMTLHNIWLTTIISLVYYERTIHYLKSYILLNLFTVSGGNMKKIILKLRSMRYSIICKIKVI